MRYRLLFVFVLLQPISALFAQNIDVTTPKHQASSLDEKLTLSLNELGARNPGLDAPVRFISNSMFVTTWAVPGALYGYGIAMHDRHAAIAGASVGLSEIVASLFTEGVKWTVKRQRPFHVLEGMRTPGGGAGDYSFPSGHSTAAWAIATSLSLHYPRWEMIAPSLLYASAVSLSRPYLGVHYVSDVAVGAGVGAGVSYLAYYYEAELARIFSFLFPVSKEENGLPTHGFLERVTPTIAPGYFAISVQF